MPGGVRYSSKNKFKGIGDARQKESDQSGYKIGEKADDIGGKPEKEKGKPEMGSIIHDHEKACSSSSSSICAVDDSDAKWESLLPENYKDIISKSASASSLNSLSKKDLYFHLRDHPIIIDNGNKSFAIDEKSGKVCCMIGAKGLAIEWAETPEYWQWKSLPDSRFSKIAELKCVYFLDIQGRIETKMLSSETTYGVYFVYKLAESSILLYERTPVECYIDFQGQKKESEGSVYLHTWQPCGDGRGDGWREIEMGEFFIKLGDQNGRLLCKLKEHDRHTEKKGLIVQGIEFRPKVG